MASTTITVETPKCPMCGEFSVLTVNREEYEAWRQGKLIQKAFPELSPGDRELLITGTHDACWDEMFAEE